ncbi:MAG: hypothetical protein ACREIC_22470, partial [Limisphaerales bacterium]
MAHEVCWPAHPVRAAVQTISPLSDRRWHEFVQKCEASSVFHTREWLEALRRTYDYEPIVFTTSPPGAAIENGLVLCRVNSWLTGDRLVSVPFSDHCDPLGPRDETQLLFTAAEQEVSRGGVRYFEMRPKHPIELNTSLLQASFSYSYHHIDLRPDLSTLFGNCHKDSTQRKIRRAEREGLRYEEGESQALLD